MVAADWPIFRMERMLQKGKEDAKHITWHELAISGNRNGKELGSPGGMK